MTARKHYLSLTLVLGAIIATIVALFALRQKFPPPELPKFSIKQNNPEPPLSESGGETATTSPNQLPTTVLLKVPFTAQAPTANWDELHNEACEEASAIMTVQYFASSTETTLKPQFVESEINKITDWFKNRYGYYLDTNSKETAEMIESVYGLKTTLLTGFTEQGLKHELSQGHVIIMSFNGKLLHNPNYKQPGPIHHMLVLKGYDSEGFITNDPGTRKGMNYTYDYDTLYTAAGDWNHATNTTDTSKKIAIIISK